MRTLPRTFIYRDKRELDDFLQDNPLNDALYDVFLDVKDSYYSLKISAENIFNEVYYQCTRLMLDSHPETRLRNYRDDAKVNMGTRYASDLVFSMVYAVLSLQKEISPSIKRILRYLEGQNLNDCYFPAFQQLVEERRGRESYESDFTPCPEPPERVLNYGTFIWSTVTENYSQERIRMIVNLWKEKEDKLAILDKIEHNFDYDEECEKNKINYDDFPF